MTMPAPVITRVSTDAVEPRHRAAYLGDALARQLAGGRVELARDATAACDWTLAALAPGTVLAWARQGAFTATRDPQMTRDGDADFSIFFMNAGAAPFEQNDRRMRLRPGEALLLAHGRPSASRWRAAECTVLRLPRAALDGVHGLDSAGGMTLRADAPAMRLLTAYVAAARPAAEVGAPPIVARHLAELARAALSEALGGPAHDGAGARAARMALMREAMAANLHDPTLGMARVAAAAGLSERAGYLAWEDAGGSFSETLYAMRLDRARERLLGGHTGKLLDLALDCGFQDLSHFNRRFRARFGCTPGDVRR